MRYLVKYGYTESTLSGSIGNRMETKGLFFGLRRENRKAQTLVEFALCLPLFLMLVFALIDFNRYSFQKQTMQRILRATARHAVVGEGLKSLDPSLEGEALLKAFIEMRKQSVIDAARNYNPASGIVNINDDKGDIKLRIEPFTEIDGDGEVQAEEVEDNGLLPGRPLTLILSSNFSFVTPLIGGFLKGNEGTFSLTEQITVVNEEFSFLAPDVD